MKKRKTLAGWYKRSGAFKWASRPKYTEKQYQPYVKAIGQLLLAWNDLHERLATLFVSAMGGGWVNRPLAVWHITRSDHAKRQLLRAAISDMPDPDKQGRKKLTEEIEWVLDAAKTLEGFRDDSAHTPLRHFGLKIESVPDMADVPDIAAMFVFPDTGFQNPRAMRFGTKEKNILTEYRYARERIIVLRDYVIAMDSAWMNAGLPWPGRPDLPERRPSRRLKDRASRRKQK